MNESIQSLCDTVKNAYLKQQALNIQGGNSKLFYGNEINAEIVSTKNLNGIIEYQPSELYITAYAGTPLTVIEHSLAEHNQMLSFEPPLYTVNATLGGTVACGLSGPRRPYADAIRDCILGTNIINGKGEYLVFGGKVMKNVAGYDVSRLMCGAFGTLGIITQVSIKVLPQVKQEITLSFEFTEQEAIKQIQQWLSELIPISATYHENNQLWIRLSGLDNTLNKIQERIGGEKIDSNERFWESVKNHRTNFFIDDTPLYRCIVPINSPTFTIQGKTSFEWNGGLRWIKSNEPFENIIQQCETFRGHASLYRSSSKPVDFMHPMSDHLKKLHLNLKRAFDPAGILNPRRMYSWC